MRKVITIAIILFWGYSCQQEENYEVVYKIAEKDLIPEGIAYSKVTNSFYLSSIYKKKIVKIDAGTGKFKDFTEPDQLGLQILGMMVDDTRKHLWACGNISVNEKRISAIFKLDLSTGELIKKYELIDSVYNMFNDLVIDKEGNIFFTNSSFQTIYKIDHQNDSITLFYDDEEIKYPNGISISPDNNYLYIASSSNGIKVLDIDSKKIVNRVNLNFNSKGIDGLKYYKNSIIGVQNYVAVSSDRNISRYFLNEEGTEIISTEIIDKDNPYFDIPTTCVIVNKSLYCVANSQLLNISDNYEIKDENALQDVIILKYNL
ncbi:MAG TPA: hypothetical protein DCG75_19955 [Bacteroidales bacterium]|jgi:WD40 repeat protein|nr:hypothetical protein [Bacteroidales bacterium]